MVKVRGAGRLSFSDLVFGITKAAFSRCKGSLKLAY